MSKLHIMHMIAPAMSPVSAHSTPRRDMTYSTQAPPQEPGRRAHRRLVHRRPSDRRRRRRPNPNAITPAIACNNFFLINKHNYVNREEKYEIYNNPLGFHATRRESEGDLSTRAGRHVRASMRCGMWSIIHASGRKRSCLYMRCGTWIIRYLNFPLV